ncbi:MAG: sulfatase-like hydrolase/transferase [Planctomycetaceae bacterium]|nr:sulfatase-like hydrolase/transferase [Planctomycetaceae bacterium]
MRTLLVAHILFFSICTGLLRANDKPNIVVIVADDLGYADVGYHGSDIQTPNIDSLAKQGVALEKFYVCPMCSPTRAGLLTGRYPNRFGLMRAVIPPWRDYGLPQEEVTLPELLKNAGYERRGIIGKWHLGHSKTEYHPLEHGFTYFYGHYNGAIDYFTHEREGEVDWHRNRETIHEEGYSTDLLAADAAKFITESPKDSPYFLYVPFNAPHSPFQAKERDIEKYPDRKGKKQILAAMIDCLDQGVGRILSAIEERGDADNTLVLFFSDNGGVRGVADNKPLRGAKLTPYEGGIHVVACARYPKGGLTGGKVIDSRCGYIDLLPTLCGLAGAEIPNDLLLDGLDVFAAWREEQQLPDRAWFTYEAQGSNANKTWAAQNDRWKAIVRGPALFATNPDLIKTELYDLQKDPYETTDVQVEHRREGALLMIELNKFVQWGVDGVPPYRKGREGFTAPKDWVVE